MNAKTFKNFQRRAEIADTYNRETFALGKILDDMIANVSPNQQTQIAAELPAIKALRARLDALESAVKAASRLSR